GVAMGLVKEEESYEILTDILGSEDHIGDMDFKVAGTNDGVTAIQMDIKIAGISSELMEEALERARLARLHILGVMTEAIAEPRDHLSQYAPNILFMQINSEKIGLIIGPGGRNIRDISERTGAEINIEDDGTIQIVSVEQAGAFEAKKIIEGMVEEPEIGKVYEGPVKKITDFGAFIEILPGQEGLLHISNLEYRRVNNVSDVLKVGEMVKVKLLDLDSQGKMDLSRKALMDKPDGYVEPERRNSRPPRGGGHSGGGRGSRR
nr:S1 RNA-binding domain-containing protein [FCB group bacterium]